MIAYIVVKRRQKKQKKYHAVGTVPSPNRIIVEIGKIDTHNINKR
jgi:hypothetical protein